MGALRTSSAGLLLLVLAVTLQAAQSVQSESRKLLQAAATCPLLFLQQDLADAAGACTSISAQGLPTASSSCCNELEGVVSLAQARYANRTGNLLISDAAAATCFKSLATGLEQLTLLHAADLLVTCNVTTSLITDLACGPELVTVNAFWEAASRSFPDHAVTYDCFGGTNCSACASSMKDQFTALAASNVTDADTLATPQCKALATTALVANAVPAIIGNGVSQCSWGLDVDTVVQQGNCTNTPWEILDFSAVNQSCGVEAYHRERCCHVMIGMFAQMLTYRKQIGLGPIAENQLDACQASFQAQLSLQGVDPSVVDTCELGGPYFLTPQGCENYTFYNDVPLPRSYIDTLDQSCSAKTCNLNCTSDLIAMATGLGPATNWVCVVYIAVQYMAAQPSLVQGTERLNCYIVLPAPLALGVNQTALAQYNVTIPGISGSEKGYRLSAPAIIGIVVAGCLVLLFVPLVGWWIVSRRKEQDSKNWSLYGSSGKGGKRSMPVVGGDQISSSQILFYTYNEVKKATNSFAADRMLGRGGSGCVFLGDLPRSGGLVAVKEISKGRTKKGSKEFVNEVESMSRCRHRHLVDLLGVCVSENHCVLVYEYMVNGSLEDHLYAPKPEAELVPARGEPVFLTWPMRYKIAVGTAKGLSYLHEGTKPRIIHRDVKPSNILLDKQFEAKVSDFGLAKFTDDGVSHVSTGIAGTWGFLAPEYVATSQLTEKIDVYSYGVVLLTLVSGRRPTEPSLPEDEVFLPEYAWIVAEQDQLRSLVDPRLVADPAYEQHWETMDRVLRVALLCIHTVISVRPTMGDCIAMLLGTMQVPDMPERPMTLFTIGQMATGLSNHSHSSCRSLRGFKQLERMDSVRESSLDAEGGSTLSQYRSYGHSDIAEAADTSMEMGSVRNGGSELSQ